MPPATDWSHHVKTLLPGEVSARHGCGNEPLHKERVWRRRLLYVRPATVSAALLRLARSDFLSWSVFLLAWGENKSSSLWWWEQARDQWA